MTSRVEVVFETHSTTEDNEAGVATGWLPGRLSATGREQARELGERRRANRLDAVFTSDLHRAVETAELALGATSLPILHDWRLRECNYGDLNGTSAQEMHRRRASHLDVPYPGGESWRQAVQRIEGFVRDLPRLYPRGRRVLVIGHVATKWGLDAACDNVALEDLVSAEFGWQEGWEYVVPLE